MWACGGRMDVFKEKNEEERMIKLVIRQSANKRKW
jgi:hypothetical protein